MKMVARIDNIAWNGACIWRDLGQDSAGGIGAKRVGL
jgi:hypothetical protein